MKALSSTIRRHRVTKQVKEQQDPTLGCLQKTHFSCKDTLTLKVKGWKNMFNANGKQE